MVWKIFYFQPYLGKISNLTNVFQIGWNHQPVFYTFKIWSIDVSWCFTCLLVQIHWLFILINHQMIQMIGKTSYPPGSSSHVSHAPGTFQGPKLASKSPDTSHRFEHRRGKAVSANFPRLFLRPAKKHGKNKIMYYWISRYLHHYLQKLQEDLPLFDGLRCYFLDAIQGCEDEPTF